MNPIPRIRYVLFAVVCLSCIQTHASAHPFHSSSAEMEWNAKERKFEVALKVDPNDLEQTLRQLSNRKIILEDLKNDDLVFAYLGRVVQLEADGKRLPIQPVGFEVDATAAWFYFEIPVPTATKRIKLTNEMLLNIPHQLNTVLLMQNAMQDSYSFTDLRKYRLFNWDDATGMFRLVPVDGER